MPVTLICVGKLKERYFADAVAEYQKRLTRLNPVTIIELADEREPDNPSEALNERVMRREGERILRQIRPKAYVIALCIDGAQLASEGLAKKLSELFLCGKSEIAFVIGGSLGLHADVLKRADEKLSMSLMTFPHQLARVMLMEQLYRAAMISAGDRYHK